MLEDKEIIEIYKSGNNDAIEMLIDRYKEPLYRFCFHLTSNKNEAEDLFQDTWVKVVDKISYYNLTSKFTTWLYSIAMNLYRDRYRKAKRWLKRVRFMFDDEEGNCEIDRFESSDAPLEEAVIEKETKKEIISVINTLKDNYRVPLILFYYRNMTYEDISIILDIPVGTVKSRLNTAKRMIKDALEVEMLNERR